MFKKIGKLIPVLALGTMLIGQSAYADSTGTVSKGDLLFNNNTVKSSLGVGSHSESNPSAIGFGELGEINVRGSIPAKEVDDYIHVEDNRGENAGWVLKVSASDLTATVLDKTTTDNLTDELTVKLPIASIFQVASSNLAVEAGDGLNVSTQSTTQLNNGGVKILEALKGYGAGAYTADLTYTLSLPNYLPSGSSIIPTDTNSAFTNITDYSHVGLFAGEYSTTVTYSITTAP